MDRSSIIFRGWDIIEKEHMEWEAQYLKLIDKIGYDNFLMAMM